MSDNAHFKAARDYVRQANNTAGLAIPVSVYVKLLSAVVHALLAIATAIDQRP